MIPIAWIGAYWLRFNLETIPEAFWQVCLFLLPIIMVLQAGVYWYFGLYRGVWRFASLPDLFRIIKAAVIGSVVSAFVVFLMIRMQYVPRAVFPLYVGLLVLLLGGARFIYRWFKDHRLYNAIGQQVLIVGAGSAGEMLVRDFLRDSSQNYLPVAFVDDDLHKHHREIHGVPVLGSCDDIAVMVETFAIDLIIIALPSANTEQMQRVVSLCEQTEKPFLTVPRVEDLSTGQAILDDLREVSIEDLLGREPVTLDWDKIKQIITQKCILVTGGGGSIGSELCRQIARMRPKQLIIFEQSEYNLFQIEQELITHYTVLNFIPYLGDICDPVAVNDVLRQYQPQLVFHAAAYKHVPMLEGQIRQAVLNNILGTQILAQAVADADCEAFVMVSTDKAVNPANIMGMSKRIAEIFCQNLNETTNTCFITVRFGNVLGSAGSVIPIFQEQIRYGGPVTVTHPDISRYFMTIPEACQLVMQACILGRGGEIFVLNMGKAVEIRYLAEQMIRLAGKIPYQDIKIEYTGLRPGEKLYEELFHEKEPLQKTQHEKILLANSRLVDWNGLLEQLTQLQLACQRNQKQQLLRLMKQLVPECHCKD